MCRKSSHIICSWRPIAWRNIALDEQNLTVPYQFITADLNNERDTYTFGLEQIFLREKQKNANLQNKIKFLQKRNQLEPLQN